MREAGVLGPFEHMIGLVRELAPDMPERDGGQSGGGFWVQLLGQSRLDGIGRCDGGHGLSRAGIVPITPIGIGATTTPA